MESAQNWNISQSHWERLSTLAKTKGFLGREFLTWLWYQAETSKQGLRLPRLASEKEGRAFEFWIDDRIFMQPYDKNGHEHLLRGGEPSRSQEAAASLVSGKVVKELKLGLRIEGLGDFTAILNADSLNPKSLQLPEETLELESAQAEKLKGRLHAIHCFCLALQSLFAQFIADRTQPEWEAKGLSKMFRWMIDRQEPKDRQKTFH